MNKITIRADELCGKHVGMYLDNQRIQLINHLGTRVFLGDSYNGWIGSSAPDDMVTLTDEPEPDLPTESGALVAADANGVRQIVMRTGSAGARRWSDRNGLVHRDENLSDPQKLVAVPKAEYEELADHVNGIAPTIVSMKRAQTLIDATEVMRARLTR